jgi:membrane associated rhomboid family serine protease
MSDQPGPPPSSPLRRLRLPSFPVKATYVLIGLNILIFLADTLTDRTITIYGALVPQLVIAFDQWWRVITSGFLHANLTHLAFNLYAFYGLGRLMERFFGTQRIGIVYLLALLGSGVLVTLFSGFNTPTLGASGAIMGVLGGLLVFYWKYRDLLIGGRGYLGQLGRMALVNIGIGLLPGISWWGHLGGFLAGALAGFAMLPRYAQPDWTTGQLSLKPLDRRAWLTSVAIIAAEGLLLILALGLRGR